MNDRALTGSAAVGAAIVVIGTKFTEVSFTETETGFLMAGAAAFVTFIAALINKVIK